MWLYRMPSNFPRIFRILKKASFLLITLNWFSNNLKRIHFFVPRINAVSNAQVRGDSYSDGCLGRTGKLTLKIMLSWKTDYLGVGFFSKWWLNLCKSHIAAGRNKFLPCGRLWSRHSLRMSYFRIYHKYSVSSICRLLCGVCGPAVLSLLWFIIPLLFPMWIPASVFTWFVEFLTGNLVGFTGFWTSVRCFFVYHS